MGGYNREVVSRVPSSTNNGVKRYDQGRCLKNILGSEKKRNPRNSFREDFSNFFVQKCYVENYSTQYTLIFNNKVYH